MLHTVHDTYPSRQEVADPSRSTTGETGNRSMESRRAGMVGKKPRPLFHSRIRAAFLALALLAMLALGIGGHTVLKIDIPAGFLADYCYGPTLQQCP